MIDVLGLLGDVRTDTGLHLHFRATPVATTSPLVALLGSSGFSAQLAGMLGLPFGFAHHFDMGGTTQAARIYREHFTPSPVLREPHLIVTAVALASESREHAIHLLAPHLLRKYGMRTGRMFPLLSPDAARRHPEFGQAETMDSNAIAGTADDVVAGLAALGDETGATELMITVPATDLDDRIDSLELTADAWGVAAPASAV